METFIYGSQKMDRERDRVMAFQKVIDRQNVYKHITKAPRDRDDVRYVCYRTFVRKH